MSSNVFVEEVRKARKMIEEECQNNIKAISKRIENKSKELKAQGWKFVTKEMIKNGYDVKEFHEDLDTLKRLGRL